MTNKLIKEELYAIPNTQENKAFLAGKWHKIIDGEPDFIFVPGCYLPDNEDGTFARLRGRPTSSRPYLMARLLWAAEEQRREK